MMLIRARLIIIAVIAAGSGGVVLNAWFARCEGTIRANWVIDGSSFQFREKEMHIAETDTSEIAEPRDWHRIIRTCRPAHPGRPTHDHRV